MRRGARSAGVMRHGRRHCHLVSVLVLLGGCGPSEPLRIAVIIPSQGGVRGVDPPAPMSPHPNMSWAVERVNAAGGPAGRKLSLEFLDTAAPMGLDAEAARGAQLAADERYVAVIGPGGSDALLAVADAESAVAACAGQRLAALPMRPRVFFADTGLDANALAMVPGSEGFEGVTASGDEAYEAAFRRRFPNVRTARPSSTRCCSSPTASPSRRNGGEDTNPVARSGGPQGRRRRARLRRDPPFDSLRAGRTG